jgi:hypothetical protein
VLEVSKHVSQQPCLAHYCFVNAWFESSVADSASIRRGGVARQASLCQAPKPSAAAAALPLLLRRRSIAFGDIRRICRRRYPDMQPQHIMSLENAKPKARKASRLHLDSTAVCATRCSSLPCALICPLRERHLACKLATCGAATFALNAHCDRVEHVCAP